MTGERILVTGGMGFIGTAVVKRLAKHNRVTVVDRLDFGSSPEVQPLVDVGTVELVTWDLTDVGEIHRRIGGGDFGAVVHLAALTHIPLCEAYPDFAYRSNVVASLNVIAHLPQGCRFINVSTSSTYAPEDRPHREDESALLPIDFYGLTKKHVEELAQYYARSKGLGIVNVRLANAAGFGETNPKLIGTILQQVHSGASLVELGNLTPRRDFIHIDDIAWVIGELLRVWPAAGGQIESFNIATGFDPVSVAELFELIVKAIGRDVEVRSVPARRRGQDQERQLLYPDPSKLKALLPSFSPKSIEQWLPAVARDPGLRLNPRLESQIARACRP